MLSLGKEEGDTVGYWHSGAFKVTGNTPFLKLNGRYTNIHFPSELIFTYTLYRGFPAYSVIKNPPAVQDPQETRVQFLSQEEPLEEGRATHSSILA